MHTIKNEHLVGTEALTDAVTKNGSVRIEDTKLNSGTLEDISIEDCEFYDVSFDNVSFENVVIENCEFVDVEIYGADVTITNTDIRKCEFENVLFDGADMTNGLIRFVDFTACELRQMYLSAVEMKQTGIYNSRFVQVRSNSTMVESKIEDCTYEDVEMDDKVENSQMEDVIHEDSEIDTIYKETSLHATTYEDSTCDIILTGCEANEIAILDCDMKLFIEETDITTSAIEDCKTKAITFIDSNLDGINIVSTSQPTSDSKVKFLESHVEDVGIVKCDITTLSFSDDTQISGSRIEKTDIEKLRIYESFVVNEMYVSDSNISTALINETELDSYKIHKTDIGELSYEKVESHNCETIDSNISYMSIESCNFVSCTLKRLTINDFEVFNTEISSTDLLFIDFGTCDINDVDMLNIDAKLDLSHSDITNLQIKVEECMKDILPKPQIDFTKATIDGLDLINVDMSECVYTDAEINSVAAEDANLPADPTPDGEFIAYRPFEDGIVEVVISEKAEYYHDITTREIETDRVKEVKQYDYNVANPSDVRLNSVTELDGSKEENNHIIHTFSLNRANKNGFTVYLTKEEALKELIYGEKILTS